MAGPRNGAQAKDEAEERRISVFAFGPGTLLLESRFRHRSRAGRLSKTAGSTSSGKSSGPLRWPWAASLPLPQRLGRRRRGNAVLLGVLTITLGKSHCALSQL